jgi:hypothetical protein
MNKNVEERRALPTRPRQHSNFVERPLGLGELSGKVQRYQRVSRALVKVTVGGPARRLRATEGPEESILAYDLWRYMKVGMPSVLRNHAHVAPYAHTQ